MIIKLGKLTLKNPVLLASGTFDKSIIHHIDINTLGGLITKTVTLKPREGNPLPHIIKTKYGYLNSVGLKNPGIKEYLSTELPFWQKFDIEIIPNIGGFCDDDYVKLAAIFNKININAIEINVSCPNVEKGLSYGSDALLLSRLIKKIKKVCPKTIIVKLGSNVADISVLAKTAIGSGADVISLINTVLALEIDSVKKKAKLAKIIGGYSGPAIKPIALRNVWQVYKDHKYAIIGGGGISSFSDALDFVMCGATAISIGSGMYLDRQLPEKIVSGFEKYFLENKIDNIKEIRGII